MISALVRTSFVSSPFVYAPLRQQANSRCNTKLTYPKRRRTNDLYLKAEYPRRIPTSRAANDDQQSARRPVISRSSDDVLSSSNKFQKEAPAEQSASVDNAAANGLASAASEEASSEPKPEQKTTGIDLSLGPLKIAIPSRWLLFTVPIMWGSFGPAVRLLFSQDPHQDPSIFNSERLMLSTLIYLPVLAAELKAFLNRKNTKPSDDDKDRYSFFPAGIELGIYVFLANIAQVIGLQQTSASRAAFLVQLQTVIVPVMAGLFGKAKIPLITWVSSLVAVTGVALLSSDKGHGTVASLSGDALEVTSALFFSAYVFRLEKYCNTVAANPLVATKIAVQAFLSIGWALFAQVGSSVVHAPSEQLENVATWTLSAVAINAAVVGWTGLVSSALSGWAQTKGQQGVPASEAVVIFATQPLWASAIATVLLGETFGPRGLAGGALIVMATLLAGRKNDSKTKDEKD